MEIFKFSYKKLHPVSEKAVDGGILYDFGKECFGKVIIENAPDGEMFLSLGESYEEALDYNYCQLCINAAVKNGTYTSEPVALRYIFVPNTNNPPTISLDFEYLPLETKASFKCNDDLINRLWQVCEYTMLLNSREGFFDGIKRDR